MLIGGVIAFSGTLWMVCRREMREKYAVVWMIMATIVLALGIYPRPIFLFAELSRLENSSAVLMAFTGLAYVFAFTVTVSLSRQYKRNMRLAQEVSILEKRLRDLEDKEEDADKTL